MLSKITIGYIEDGDGYDNSPAREITETINQRLDNECYFDADDPYCIFLRAITGKGNIRDYTNDPDPDLHGKIEITKVSPKRIYELALRLCKGLYNKLERACEEAEADDDSSW